MFIRNALRRTLLTRGGHHHELVNFTNGPPSKTTPRVLVGFFLGVPVTVVTLWYAKYVGNPLARMNDK
ncbi:hypothetical protein ABK040_007905 [Willaertia magna]